VGRFIKLFLAALAIVIAIIGIKSGYDTGKQVTYPVAYGEWIMKYSTKNELDPFLVMAVIKQESNFVPEAHSGVAGGLMQLTQETAQWNANELGITDFDYMDPETNIELGCHYLKYLIKHYGNVDTALAAYNGGMGNVDAWLADKTYSSDGKTLDNIPFAETRNYVVKVNEYWAHYKELYY
jgi:soluble lytic murein transglycosylase